jgi:hypothetical protein
VELLDVLGGQLLINCAAGVSGSGK